MITTQILINIYNTEKIYHVYNKKIHKKPSI